MASGEHAVIVTLAIIGTVILAASVFIVVTLWEIFDNEEGIDD